ncbi:MAG: ABC transporter ATP-binding protein [Pseudomonadota bacterium]
MSDQTPRLEARNLVQEYGGRRVVDDVSLSVMRGQVTCLLGPSGCGKSTTLRILAGVEQQASGEIRVDGALICDAVTSQPPEQRNIGLMFQDFALFPHLRVADNIAFGLTGDGFAKSQRVDELLIRVGLSHYRDSFPHELSGGEQQRVALARALAPKPRIMLMDEPFSGLDNRLRDGIRDETLEILREEDTAVLLVTHEPEEAMRMADQIALMREGRIVQQGAPFEIFNHPADRNAVAFFSDINVVKGVVENGKLSTAFGSFVATAFSDGATVEVVARPQHMRLDFHRDGNGPAPTEMDGVALRGRVHRARFMGSESLVEFRMEHDSPVADAVFKVSVPAVFLPKPDTPMWLSIRRDKCFLFEA